MRYLLYRKLSRRIYDTVCCSDFIRGNGAPLHLTDVSPVPLLHVSFFCITLMSEMLLIHLKAILEALAATVL